MKTIALIHGYEPRFVPNAGHVAKPGESFEIDAEVAETMVASGMFVVTAAIDPLAPVDVTEGEEDDAAQ